MRSRKRFLVFICIFAFLSGVTLLAIQNIEAENLESLMTEKAVVVKQSDWDQVTQAQLGALESVIDRTHGNQYVTKYMDLGNVKIFGIDSTNPWANSLVKPNRIHSGNYIQGSSQVLLSDDFSASVAGFSYKPAVGSSIDFSAEPLLGTFQVVGKFAKPAVAADADAWMFVDQDLFDELDLQLPSTVYIYEVVAVAGGSTILNFLYGDAYVNVEEMKTNIQEFVDLPANSVWASETQSPDVESRMSERSLKQMFLLFGVVGGVIVATMYAFLISRFRTREVAILKAIGYSAGSVRIMLLGEILTVSVLGFMVALVMIQLGVYLNNIFLIQTAYVPIILLSLTSILSFIVIVLSNGLGILIVSRRAVAVRPIELFQSDR
jgi:hypothetical protein